MVLSVIPLIYSLNIILEEKMYDSLWQLRNVNPPELVQKLSGPLFRTISLNRLKKANITSLDQVEDKPLTLTQVHI